MPCNHACDTDRCSKWWASLSYQVPFRQAGGCSSWVDVLSPVVQYQRCRAVSNEHTPVLVQDGYYNARELDEEVFKPLGAKLYLDMHTGLLQLTTKNDNIMMSSELAKVLGFSQNTFEGAKMLLRNGLTRSGRTYTADEPHRLAVHR